MTDAGGLHLFERELNQDVLREVRTWRDDAELRSLLAKLQSHTEAKAFFDAWAEAVLARHLRERGCGFRFEVPTPNDRRADFEVAIGGATFYLHLKRLDSQRPSHKRLVVSSRLRVLERVRRPYVVQVRWREGADDADMQSLVAEAERFLLGETARVGDEHRIIGDDGREIGGVRIIAPNVEGAEHVSVTIGLPTGFIDVSPRMRRLMTRAHEQFMPGGGLGGLANVIVIASDHDDDVIDFETALLGSHIERWDQYPQRGQRIAHGRAPDGFWHGRRFHDSAFAVWMRFAPREDAFRSRLYVRKSLHPDEKLTELLESLFERE